MAFVLSAWSFVPGPSQVRWSLVRRCWVTRTKDVGPWTDKGRWTDQEPSTKHQGHVLHPNEKRSRLLGCRASLSVLSPSRRDCSGVSLSGGQDVEPARHHSSGKQIRAVSMRSPDKTCTRTCRCRLDASRAEDPHRSIRSRVSVRASSPPLCSLRPGGLSCIPSCTPERLLFS